MKLGALCLTSGILLILCCGGNVSRGGSVKRVDQQTAAAQPCSIFENDCYYTTGYVLGLDVSGHPVRRIHFPFKHGRACLACDACMASELASKLALCTNKRSRYASCKLRQIRTKTTPHLTRQGSNTEPYTQGRRQAKQRRLTCWVIQTTAGVEA